MLNLLSIRLKKRFPELQVDTQLQPLASSAYDIYILDNDFEGHPLAAELAEQIKQAQPDSLVVALSGTLSTETLKRLLNCGCDGAFDKGLQSDIDQLFRLIQSYIDDAAHISKDRRKHRASVLDTAQAIAGLIRDWNRRLELEEIKSQDGRAAGQGGVATMN